MEAREARLGDVAVPSGVGSEGARIRHVRAGGDARGIEGKEEGEGLSEIHGIVRGYEAGLVWGISKQGELE